MEERNLDLMSRNENTRDKFHTEVIQFDLDQILQHFIETVDMIKLQFHIANELIASGKRTEGEKRNALWILWRVFREGDSMVYKHINRVHSSNT